MEKVAVWIKYLALSLDVSLLPVCLNPSTVGECDCAETLFATVNEVAFVLCAVVVVVLSPTVFLAFHPLAFVLIYIGITHRSLALFDIILPLSFIYVSIGVSVSSPSLFTITYSAFI